MKCCLPALRCVGPALLLLAAVLPCTAQGPLFVDIKAANVRFQPERDAVAYSGGIEITYEDAVITADNCVYETGKNQAVFTGSVRVKWRDHTVTAVWVYIDFEKRTYEAKTCRVELDPSLFGSRYVQDPLYLSAKLVEGDQEEIRLHDAFVTPCDRYEDPHLGLESHFVKVYRRGKWIKTTAIKGKVKGQTVLWMPGFGIRTRYFTGSDFTPNFGRSTYDGFWGEVKWFYNDNGAWDIRASQLRGTKIAHDYYYMLGNSGQGSSLITYDTKLGSFTGNIRHSQQFGQNTRLDGSYDLRQTSSDFAGTSTSQNTTANFSRNVGSLSLRANYNSSTTTTVTESRTNSSSNISAAKDLWGGTGNQASVQVDARISANDVAAGQVNREMNTHAEFTQPTNLADFDLVYDRRTDLDGSAYTGDNSYSSLDRLPELVTKFDLRDLNIDQFSGRGMLSVGRFLENPNALERNRLAFDFDASLNPIKIQNSTTLNIAGLFKQRVYRQDEAIYTLGARASAQTEIGSIGRTTVARTRLDWNWKTFDGYSPFRFDYATKAHDVRGSLDLSPDTYTKMGLSTSYDIEHGRWSDLRIQASRSKGLSRLSLSTGYDLQQHKWRSLTGQFGLTVIDRFSIDAGAMYDLDQNQLSTVRAQLDWQIFDKWRFELLTSFDGRRGEFTTNTARLTHEFHDFYATATYDQTRGLFEFGVSLKAFPSLINDILGSGRAGELVDTTIPTGGGF